MSKTTRKPRRATDKSQAEGHAPAPGMAPVKAPSKLDQVQALLLGHAGASIAELVEATGWQQHSVRGAMAGSLKKRGLAITSEKVDGTRRYRASKAS